MNQEQRKLLRSHAETAIRLESSAGLSNIHPVFNAKPEVVLSLLDENDRMREALLEVKEEIGNLKPLFKIGTAPRCACSVMYSKIVKALEEK